MRSRIAALLLLCAALLVCAASASASALPGLLTALGRGPTFAVRPAQILYTGDGSGILGGATGTGPLPRFGSLRWASWTSQQAIGTGAVWLDDCTPSCAGGRYHPYAVRVHAFAPRSGHFTRLTLRYAYEGKEVIDRRGIQRVGSSYRYVILGGP